MGTITSEEMNEYSNLNSNRAVKPVFLSDFVKYDKLFKSYPQLKDVTLSIDSDMSSKEKGFYDNGLKEIHINSKLTGDEAVKTIIHEVQHAIQHIEKFATGANGSNENYNRVAGEIEARDSSRRSSFTEEQRKNIRPDIDRTDVRISNDDVKYSIIKDFTDDNGNNYYNIVYLDTNLFNHIKPRYWGKKLISFVYNNLAGKQVVLYDENNNSIKVEFAKINERVKKVGANNGHKVIDKLARKKDNISRLAVAHSKEIIEVSIFNNETDEKSHQWLDENGWEHRSAIIVDKRGNIYKAILNIAKAKDGRKILYDINKISNIGHGAVSSKAKSQRDSHINSNIANHNIARINSNVNNNFADEGRKLGANLPGKKFSIFEDGTDKNLVAMHNLSADNLETALNRGGFPMPSIAVTKDNISHNDFGEVSVLFDKDTIDPEINNNYVYGSDVYSPTHPGLEYKINENKSKEVYDYFKDELKNKDMALKVNPVNFSSANLSKKINSLKGEENYIKSFENDYGMKNLYLSLSNNQVDKVNDTEKTEVKDVDELTADFYNYLYDTMGQKIETVRNMVGRNWYKENKEQFKSVVQSYVNSEKDSSIRAKKKAFTITD